MHLNVGQCHIYIKYLWGIQAYYLEAEIVAYDIFPTFSLYAWVQPVLNIFDNVHYSSKVKLKIQMYAQMHVCK